MPIVNQSIKYFHVLVFDKFHGMNYLNSLFKISIIFAVVIISSCKKRQSAAEESVGVDSLGIAEKYNEQYRPQFHFSPPEKWMNDPNGLVYHNGLYHLFYQYYPDDIVWGPMHWGHAVSEDLIHWKHKPIALYPDEHGLIFSGSAVVDKENTSGFGSLENPPMVAIFTYHLMEGEKTGRTDFQTQGIAYSLDNGDTWKKYDGNPVIKNNMGIKDFRDPKVFWHDETRQWIMALVAGDHAKFYSSTNLKDWKHLSDFGKDKGAHGGVWECPDLFKLNVDGKDEEKWVLIISINPGAPNGGSGTQYFTGDFDGTTFTAEHEDTKWLDYGTDNYAGVTYNNAPSNQRIFIGWMSNWNYARNTPTKVWRSAMTLPRKLSLVKESAGYFIKSTPIDAVEQNIKSPTSVNNYLPGDKVPVNIENDHLNQSRVSFTIAPSESFELLLTNNENDKLILGIDRKNNQAYIDRTASGAVAFEKSFGASVHKMPIGPAKDPVDIKLYLDRSSIEFFINAGRYVMTDQVFPQMPFTKVNIKGSQHIQHFKIEPIKSIWRHE